MYFMDEPPVDYDRKYPLNYKKYECENAIAIQHEKQQEIRNNYEIIKLHEESDEHFPWGGPGGGAPNQEIRRSNILLKGLFPESNDNCRKYSYQRIYRIKQGGGGAPLRDSAGRIVTTIREDPNITFHDSTRSHVDNHLRYKTTTEGKRQYKMELDKCVADKGRRCKFRRTSIENKQDPWGRMGPGGAPWRKPAHVGQSFMKSMGWTDENLLRTIDKQQNNYSANTTKQTDQTTSKRNDSSTLKLPFQCCANCFCDCKTKFALSNNSNKIMDKQSASNDIKKPKYIKPRSCMITGGVELVPLLAKRRAMQRPISLSTTDVTRQMSNNNQNEIWKNNSVKLLDDLCKQMSQKERRTRMCRDDEVESSQLHFQTIDTFWGRPGHGAPLNIKTKYNLNDLLYRTWT